ncbi:hypothetical protein DBT_0574 [Dissulfuribacter thermophilus]|uniref:Glycosyltransferase 2-like domain-containing protein n=1 Tax=Dissulfuribacter thermophilus TaxID=1156395 RepID=A0A1B9F870_9BACT|nr:TIGR04283 family arsenosugar biosynthesis glycosyltransferase [Dissulfuribacter thermophilus]OCC16112.1 hypothetical protein DBT_0574 [Dissulfuribacter thermophilus]
MNKTISVIIPCLNEKANIGNLLKTIEVFEDVEAIVVDGGSSDGTPEIAKAHRTKLLKAGACRGSQLNAGARAAGGDIFFFVHGDSTIPRTFKEDIYQILLKKGATLGAFRLKIDSPSPPFRLVETMVNLRSSILSLPYGDQGLFIKREDFFSAGGFKDYPIMEDFDFVRRMKKRGRILLARSHIKTSPRRWGKYGILRTTFLNQLIILGFFLGVPPNHLVRLYYPRKTRKDL